MAKNDNDRPLVAAVKAYNAECREALLAILAELNKGQRKKVLKNATVRAWFERFGIEVDE